MDVEERLRQLMRHDQPRVAAEEVLDRARNRQVAARRVRPAAFAVAGLTLACLVAGLVGFVVTRSPNRFTVSAAAPTSGTSGGTANSNRHVARVLTFNRGGITEHLRVLDRSPELTSAARILSRASKFEVSQHRPPVPSRCFPDDMIEGELRVGVTSTPIQATAPHRPTEAFWIGAAEQHLLPDSRLLFFVPIKLTDASVVSVKYLLNKVVRDTAATKNGWVVLATILSGKEAAPPWAVSGEVQGFSPTGRLVATISLPHNNGFQWC